MRRQGLLISRRHYDKVSGYRALPLMEDVSCRIGAPREAVARAQSQCQALQARGYVRRALQSARFSNLNVPPAHRADLCRRARGDDQSPCVAPLA
jgi:hypothetical protein